MYVHSVKLTNFKSIGDYDESEIIIEPNVTAIIGKNESGKSNVLEGLSKIDFYKNNVNAFLDADINRNHIRAEIKYTIVLKPNNNDADLGLSSDTKIEITKGHCVVTGGLYDLYQTKAWSDIETLIECLDRINPYHMQMRDPEVQLFKEYKQAISQKEALDLYSVKRAIDFLISKSENIPQNEKETFKEITNKVNKEFMSIQSMLPVFFYRRTDKHLYTTYKYEDISKELNNQNISPDSLLRELVRLINVSKEDFLLASASGINSVQTTLRNEINKQIDSKINEPFQNFYTTENIRLKIDFNAGNIVFSVSSKKGPTLMLSERSNGLRWYLDAFIDAKANEIADHNVVYLFDEPGISLHINAQKELLNLFKDLSSKNNQVIYTTHLPNMLDTQDGGIHRIRSVVKDDGFTHIYKTAYDQRITKNKIKDTLTPIVDAIGMNMYDSFGPAKGKLNIVTEGVSDYIYLLMMAKVLGIDLNKYSIIPSNGVTTAINICFILHGWGCRYIGLFDYDNEGVNKGGECLRKEYIFEYKKHYCYITDVTQKEVDDKTYKNSPSRIEDLITHKEISKFCNNHNISKETDKTLKAKLMNNAIEDGDYSVGDECKNNFDKLFNLIETCFKNQETC